MSGYKAGALRLALAHTADDAEIIAVIDADYVVQPNWLKDLVPAFADAKVGMVQAPQDHRDGERTVMHHAMNGEYAGFFDIGMVQRNEANAIIVHGTMCLIRRTALASAGGWSSDTIVEDSDLGLLVLEHGWQIHYTNRRYGHGLLPDTFDAYKKQHHRWAYGGLQILRKHWRHLLPRAAGLSREQKREFALGWLNWLGAEAIGVVVAILNLIWVPVVAFVGIAIPDTILTVPILAAFVVTLAHFISLYRLRVAVPIGQMVGAVVAAMAVQWTVARAVGLGLCKESLPFMRTAKGGTTSQGTGLPGLLGGGDGRAAADRRVHRGRDELQADPRGQYFRTGARGAEPAVHRGGRNRRAGRLPLQRIRLLAQRRGEGGRPAAAAGRRCRRAGAAARRQAGRNGAVEPATAVGQLIENVDANDHEY